MSSEGLEKPGWSPRAPSERVLMTLKMHGALTSAQVGRMLGVTGEGARQQLSRLAESGLVADERRSAGRGRPATVWRLTQAGHDRFPDTHANLTVDILQGVSEILGEAALDRIIAAREATTQARYEAAMAGCADLRARVERLAELRSEEGYMAAVETGPDGELMLVENHCPICAAASVCQGFCRAEKQIFESVLGPGAEVERLEHILRGARRCAYRIRPRRAAA